MHKNYAYKSDLFSSNLILTQTYQDPIRVQYGSNTAIIRQKLKLYHKQLVNVAMLCKPLFKTFFYWTNLNMRF